mgnify:FL=1
MSNIFLYYGEEKYDLELSVQKIKKTFSNLQVGVNLYYLNLDNIDELPSLLQGVTFFGSEKLIIIKNTNLKFNVDLLEDIDKDIKVVIIEDSIDKRTSEYKKLSKIAECVEFKHLDDKQMINYIIQILKKYGITISYDNALYMQSVCGNDKTNNINELKKIVIYLGNEKQVTKEIIDKVCSKTLNAKIFDVLNLIVNKNKKEAIRMLNELLEQKESIVKIYIMLYKQVKQMYMIKLLKEKHEINIAQILGMHPYTFKNLSKSCENYNLQKLKSIIYDFDEYDEKTKIGEMDFEIGLKKIICNM